MISPRAYVLRNEQSPSVIPSNVAVILDDVINELVRICGSSLSAVYLEGSVGRGDFRPGKSDIDIVAILSSPLTPQKDTIRNRIRPGIAARYAGQILDISMPLLSEIDANLRTQFILATDGLLLHGQTYVPASPLPVTYQEVVRILAVPLLSRVDEAHGAIDAIDRGESVDVARVSRWFSKQVLRLAFGIALLRGAEYSSRLSDAADAIEDVVPELGGIAKDLMRYDTQTATDKAGLMSQIDEARPVFRLASQEFRSHLLLN